MEVILILVDKNFNLNIKPYQHCVFLYPVILRKDKSLSFLCAIVLILEMIDSFRGVFFSKMTSVLFLQLTLCTLATPKMSSLANSGDHDDMPHIVAFHQGLHCLLRQK